MSAKYLSFCCFRSIILPWFLLTHLHLDPTSTASASALPVRCDTPRYAIGRVKGLKVSDSGYHFWIRGYGTNVIEVRDNWLCLGSEPIHLLGVMVLTPNPNTQMIPSSHARSVSAHSEFIILQRNVLKTHGFYP